MKITINTDGSFDSTSILFNEDSVTESNSTIGDFHLSIHPGGKVKLKLLTISKENGKLNFISMYADDFKQYDNSKKLIKEGKKNG